jgi:hypothetical protein
MIGYLGYTVGTVSLISGSSPGSKKYTLSERIAISSFLYFSYDGERIVY